jgi:hypothetical protein
MKQWRTFYRAAQAFKWGSRTFRKGKVVRADDPIIERVNRERPDLLLVTVTRTDLDSRRPVEVAGLRSSNEPRPRRDWLADEPWRRKPAWVVEGR